MKFSGKWKELENIILSEVTQTQKDKHGLSPLLSWIPSYLGTYRYTAPDCRRFWALVVRRFPGIPELKHSWNNGSNVSMETLTGRKIIAFSSKDNGNDFYSDGQNRTPYISGHFPVQAVMTEKNALLLIANPLMLHICE
ncbi:hypothetical protein STEG23_015564, partial [Scotinomys teguina]